MRNGHARTVLLLVLALWLPASTCPTWGAPKRDVVGQVLNVTPDGLYIDIGRKAGLVPGDSGYLLRAGREVARVEVVLATANSARLRITTRRDLIPALPGDQAVLEATGSLEEEKAPSDPPPANDSSARPPLLEPPRQQPPRARARNIFHGSLRFRSRLQHDPKNLQDASRLELGSNGSLDRIEGSPWSLEWSWNGAYRDGHAYDGARDSLVQRFDLFELELTRPLGPGTTIGLGRFLPHELSEVGYVDGVQAERRISETVWLGAMVGLKPDRLDLNFSSREPLGVAYATLERPLGDRDRYSSTLGLLGSLYEGEADRLSLLLDQNLRYQSLRVFWNSAVDLDVGGADKRNGINLTQLDLSAHLALSKFLSVRTSVDHDERLDTQAERDAYEIDDDHLFGHGFWRYTVGATQNLPRGFVLDEQVSYIHGEDSEDDPYWQLSVTKTGLPSLPQAHTTINIYNLVGIDTDGYGGRWFANFPFRQGRVQLQPGLGFRFLENEITDDDFDLTDLYVNLYWRMSKPWTTSVRLSHLTGDDLATTALQVSVTYRW